MSYATVAHVKARAGHLSRAWGEDTAPADADIEGFLADVASEINAAIGGLGLSIPAEDSLSARSLVGMNADGALILALDATWPAGEGPSAATELQKAVRARYEKLWDRLLAGKLPATTVVVSDSIVPSATDFWSENPDYGRPGSDFYPTADFPANPAIDPEFVRGMKL